MILTHISVSKDFSRTPGGRYREDGPFSGVEFREDFVEPSLKQAILERHKLAIDLDGVSGYATSFLEETFGGLVRSLKQPVRQHLEIITKLPLRMREVEEYIRDEENKL